MARYTGPRKMGEERAAELVIPIARRVQRNHPDAQPMGILVAAASLLFLAGYADPKDRHVLHAAERMRARLRNAEDVAPDVDRGLEERELDDDAAGDLLRLTPLWERAMEITRASVPDSTWRLWLAPLVLCGRRGDRLLVSSTAPGIRSWAERRYSSLILEAARQVEPAVGGIDFVRWVPKGTPMWEGHTGADGRQPRTDEGSQQ